MSDQDKPGRPEGTPPTKSEDTLTLTKSELIALLRDAAVESARAAVDAQAEARQARTDDSAFLADIQAMDPGRREAALIAHLGSMTDAERARREESIRTAYGALPEAPTAASGLRPGTLVEIGKDNQGAPLKAKVRYTKDWIDENYPKVDLYVGVVPRGGVTVHNINYRLERGLNKVPSLVAEQYAWWADTQDRIERTFPPLTLAEEEQMRLALARGARQVGTRVHQVGVGILPPDVFPQPAATGNRE